MELGKDKEADNINDNNNDEDNDDKDDSKNKDMDVVVPTSPKPLLPRHEMSRHHLQAWR